MGVTNSNKTASLTQINCDGTFDVTLALTATPDITTNPTDIVLVLDRSGSMEGSALANLKLGAKTRPPTAVGTAKSVQAAVSVSSALPAQPPRTLPSSPRWLPLMLRWITSLPEASPITPMPFRSQHRF